MQKSTSRRLFFATVAVVAMYGGDALAQQAKVSISRIEANESISGQVIGLDPQATADYKILVYVRTDKWYIHPFAGQDEGKTWALIQRDGTWRIATVQRDHRASAVAAVLVRKNYPEPNTTESLERLQHTAIAIKELRGTPDYGKL